MGFCWPLQLPPTQKAVLMALADAANDDGVCWIAVKSRREDKLDLMVKTCLSERAVQAAIKALCDIEWLERNERPGQGCWYIVTPPGFLAGRPPAWLVRPTPAPPAGAQMARGAQGAGTPAPGALTPAPPAGKPSSTLNNRDAKASSVGKKKKSTAAKKMHLVPEDWEPKESHLEKVAAFGWPDGIFEEQVEAFREWEFTVGKTDFDRAFHRWLRTHNDRLKGRTNERFDRNGAGPGPGRGPASRADRIDAMREGAMGALDRFRREGR